jgi:hypothetical protein
MNLFGGGFGFGGAFFDCFDGFFELGARILVRFADIGVF